MGSTTAEQSLDLLQSDKTDSLFQSSTLNESAQTLSEHTLEAELPSDYDTIADNTINANDDVTIHLEAEKVIDGKVDQKEGIVEIQDSPDEVTNEMKPDFTEVVKEISSEVVVTAVMVVDEKIVMEVKDEVVTEVENKEDVVTIKEISEQKTDSMIFKEEKTIVTSSEPENVTQTFTFVESKVHVKTPDSAFTEKIEDQLKVEFTVKEELKDTEVESHDAEPTTAHFVESDLKDENNVTEDISKTITLADTSIEDKVVIETKTSRSLKDSVHVTSLSPSKVATMKEKEESVELIPNLNWQLRDKDKFIPSKESQEAEVDVQGSLDQDQFGSSPPEGSSDTQTGSSHETPSSVPSSRMSERSGTQSSIELRSSSRSSHSTGPDVHFRSASKSSSSAVAGDERMSGISESSGSPCQPIYSSSPYTEEITDDSKISSRPATGSDSCSSKKQVTVTDSALEYPAQDQDDKSPTAQLRSSGEISPHSLPSSPRQLRRTVSNGVKKLTSELFSTDNDLSRSLEIVYSEPSTDERRKLSERYSHTSSSSGASNGSVNNDQNKIEKRKASFTQVRKTPDELATGELLPDSTTPSGQESDGLAKSAEPPTTTSDGEMKLQHSSEPTESKTSPIKEKKTASPTKILAPAPASGATKEKTCSEEFSPMLQVECKTPECKRSSTKDPSKEDDDNVDEIPPPKDDFPRQKQHDEDSDSNE